MLLTSVLLLGCGGESADPDTAQGGWPVGSPVDTVLAYVAGAPDSLRLPTFFENQLGWQPAGLAGERQGVVAFLDSSVMGGPLGLALPVADPDALRDSLAACPGIEFTDDKRFVFTLPADSELINAIRAVRAMTNTGSLTEMMAAIGQPVAASSTWELSFREGQALIVPSFEAAFVVGKLLDELPLDGLESGGLESASAPTANPGSSVVLSVDMERIRLTYYEEFQQSSRQLQALLSGDPDAGPVGTLGRMLRERGGGGGDGPLGELPVDGPTVLAMIEMLAVDSIGAFQLQADGWNLAAELFDRGPGATTDEGSSFDETATPDPASGLGQMGLVYRQRWSEPSALSALLDSLRPVPAQGPSGQRAMLSADPDDFPRALAAWLRPLIEVVHGPGEASAERLDDLAELLSPWDGLLMVGESDGTPLAVATLQPGERLNTSALLAWFRPLLDAVEGGQHRAGNAGGAEGADGEGRDVGAGGAGSDGSAASERRVLDPDDELPLSTWSLDDLLVIGTGDEDPLAVEDLLDTARALRELDTPDTGPWLELLFDAGQLSVTTVGDSLEIALGASPAAVTQESR